MAKKKNIEQYKDDLLKRYNEGESLRSIAKSYGVTHATVSRIISKYQELRAPKGKQQEVLDKIYPLYLQGYLVHHIAKELGIGSGTVKKHLGLKYGITETSNGAKPLKYEHLIDELKKEYQRGDTLTEIASRHNVSRQTVLSYLNQQGIEARDYKEANRLYPINEDYFETLNEKKSRQLGLIYAYGVLVDVFQGSVLRLAEKEGCEALFVEAFDGVTTDLEERIHYNEEDGIAFLQINSDKIYNQLKQWDFPNQLPNLNTLDEEEFWRGFLQARTTCIKSKRPIIHISFPSSELKASFLDYIHRIFKGELEFPIKKDSSLSLERKVMLKLFFNQFPFLLDKVTDEAEGLTRLKNEGYFSDEIEATEVTSDKTVK